MSGIRKATGIASFGIFVLLLASPTATGCSITVRNQCPYTVTTCAQSANDPISQYNIGAGGSQTLDFGAACRWPAGAIYASTLGQCIAPGAPSNAANDRNRANLAEFTIGDGSGNDFYDLSNVDAYTIPLLINPTQIAGGATRSGQRCGTIICNAGDVRSLCAQNTRNTFSVAPTGAATCFNTDGPGPPYAPSAATQVFRNACPTSYSWSKEDETSTYTCTTGTNYEVVFCP